MIIPDRVNVCGIKYGVETDEKPLTVGNNSYCGLCSHFDHRIILYRYQNMIDERNTPKTMALPLDDLVNTFWHEVWHAITETLGMIDVNTELNAQTFAMVASNLIHDGNVDVDVAEVFDGFKEIVTEISEQDYRRIQYVVTNTEFEFDKLSDDYREVKIVVGYEDVFPESLADEQVEEPIMEDKE